MQTATAAEWARIVEALGGYGETAVVAGEDVAGVVRELRLSGAPPIAAEGESVAVLSCGEIGGDPQALDDLDAGIADVVLLRRAWRDRPGLAPALRAAYRVARSGGRLVAADIDLDRLLGSSAIRYPQRLQFSLLPEIPQAARISSTRMPLSIEAGRAGFRDIRFYEFDEERRAFPDARAYWESVKSEGWPVFGLLPPAEAEALLERAAGELRRVAPIGPIIDRRPWFVVAGVKR